MAKSKNIGKPSVRIHTYERSIGDRLMMTLFLKNREFQNLKYLSNPAKFIFEKLKTLEKSLNIHNQLAFKVMVFFVLHDGEFSKWELDDISQHALFVNLKKMDDEASNDGCIEYLLDLFIEETADGRSYRILHDVITSISVRIPLEIYPEVVRLIYQRTGMIGVLQNSRLYEDQKFREEWENAELYFTNERQAIETVY
uniref:Uncharacterized protein n=1 Tax=Magallana gigas TaxID=29159 RepID=A0A8W8N1Y1_MAGGI